MTSPPVYCNLFSEYFFENIDATNSKFEPSFSVIKMYILKILLPLKMDFQKYKINVILDLIFIILGLFLQIINVNTLILIAKIFKSP